MNIEDAYKDHRFHKEVDIKSGYHTGSCLCMPIKNSDNEIIGVMQMLNKKDTPFDKGDEEFLRSLSNYSATALELATLHEQLVDKERIEHELGIARQIQISLLPHSIPEIEGYEALGHNNSCEQVSGDYYDMFYLDKDRKLFAIGDVSGKGVPASLMMAQLQSHLKAITQSFHELPEIMKMLNEYLIKHSTSEKYITFFLGILDLKEHKFDYVNAGHNPPLKLNKKGEIEELKMGGPVIGMFGGLDYQLGSTYFDKGDLLFGFTDGVTECFNKDEEEYGEERLYSFLKKNSSQTMKEIFENMVRELKDFSQGQKQSDDITILMLKRK